VAVKRPIAREVVAGHRLPATEAEILRVLFAASRPLRVAEVQDRLEGRKRAHTTIVTLLGRLVERGLVQREGDIRGHRYAPAGTEQELAAAALGRILQDLDDPDGALVAFINRLPAATRRGLRQRLTDPGERRR
jgi:predicted transcriptional regulator